MMSIDVLLLSGPQ